jgi:hypothetical protein
MNMNSEWVAGNDGTFSFVCGELGWKNAVWGLTVDGVALRSDLDYRTEGDRLYSDKTDETVTVIEQTDAYIVIRRDIKNISDKPIALSGIQDFFVPAPLAIGGPRNNSYIFHCEAIFEWGRHRVYFKDLDNRPPQTVLGDPLSMHFGATGWSPYTGIVFANDQNNSALIEGTLSQNRFYRYWTPKADGSVCATMGMFGIDAKIVAPGETLTGELIYLEINMRFDPSNPFNNYNTVLDKYITFHAKEIKHNQDFIWGTWNDGPYNMVHDFIVRDNTDWVKDNLPSVNWIQIDDGYQILNDHEVTRDETNLDTGFGRPRVAHYHFLEEDNAGISKQKFPDGMKATADYIRSKGLRPAIWTGLHTTAHTKIVQNHRDWFQAVFKPKGELTEFVPDVSIQECMDTLKEGFRIMIKDWGYEGIKLDFWTYGFIANQRPYFTPFKYSLGNKTGLEYMHELFGYVRGLLGDGYLETCCDISCGNPFMGQYADNFRFGIDVGDGNWNNAALAAKWMSFHTLGAQRLGFLPNADSIGVLKGLSPIQRDSWNIFCFTSGSMLEIGGDFTGSTEKIDPAYLKQGRPALLDASFGCDADILDRLRKLTAHVENGTKVIFPDSSYLETEMPPAIWVKCDCHDQPAYIGIFNWLDMEQEIILPMEFFNGIEHFSDFFSGAEWCPGTSGKLYLQACESCLLTIGQ